MNTKNKAVILVMFILVLLSCIFLWMNISDKNRQLDLRISSERKQAEVVYNVLLSQIRQELLFEAQRVGENDEIAKAFAHKDREALYELMRPIYDETHQKYQLMAFIGADNHHFLRVHDRLKYGDDISSKRPIIGWANRTKSPVAAFEATNYGIDFIQIVPIFYKGVYIGFFHIGTKADTFQQKLGLFLDAKSAIFFDAKHSEKFAGTNSTRRTDGFTLASSNDAIFSSLPKDFAFNDKQQIFTNGKTYITHIFNMNDYHGNTIAKKVFIQDITSDVKETKNMIEQVVVLTLALLVAVYFILHFSFDILISQIEAHEQELLRQLYTDRLTGLANRARLQLDAKTLNTPELALINVDDFKEINDLYGIATGDFILREIADRVVSLVGESSKVYRLSGDEFGILSEAETPKEFKESMALLLSNFAKEQFSYNENKININITIGASIGIESFLERADMALKNAKKQRLPFVLFDRSMEIAAGYEKNIKTAKLLKEAVENDRIVPFYQPIINCQTGRIEKYECLARLIKEDGEIVSPYQFLDISKKTKLYDKITYAVAQKAFKKFDTSKYGFSINLSLEDILSPVTTAMIVELLEACSSPQKVVFEILESDGFENYDDVAQFIHRVKEQGAKIAIDDFGTGYSNFEHLLRLNVDFIKIDASMIKNIHTDTNSQIITETIVGFAKRLNIKTIAEFVHSKEVYEKVRSMGIDYAQGYYLGEPKEALQGTSCIV